MHRIFQIVLVASVLGGVTPADASGQPEQQSPHAARAAQSVAALDEVEPAEETVEDTVVVTASLEEEERADLPVAVTVITASDIEARQATHVEELLRTVPGVAVARSGGPGAVTSTFVRGANSNQTLVLWNGVKLNDPYFRGFDWAFLPTDGAERVEIVRGPASALYGSEAIGGVVQVVSGAAPGATLRTEAGTGEYLRGAATVSGTAAGERLSYLATGQARRGDGPLTNDFYDGEEAATRADWRVTPELSVGLLARGHASEVGLPLGFAGPTPNRVQERDSLQLALPVAWSSGPWEVEAQLSRTTTDLEVTDPDDTFNEGVSAAARSGARLVVTRRFGAGLWTAVGADFEREEIDATNSFGPVVTDRDQSTWSGFGELHWEVGRLSLDVGARRDDNDTFGAETSARLGAVVRLGGGFALRAHYGEGFRAPSLGELYFPGASNPELAPETSATTELGLDWRRSGARLALTGYDTDFDDLVVYPAPAFVPVNVGRARARGIEAEAELGLGRWKVLANGTFQETEDLSTGEPLLRRPEEAGNLLVTWRGGLWTVHSRLSHVGERPDFGVALDAYTTLELGLARRFGRLEPYARVENLLDEEYQEAAGFPARGRAVVGGIALHLAGSGR